MKGLRGIDSRQEQSPDQLIRDTRTLGQKTADLAKNPVVIATVVGVLGVLAVVMPPIADLCFVLGVFIFWVGAIQHPTLPFRMPQNSGALDYNDLKPNKKPNKARGIYYFGNSKEDDQELWFTNEDMRTHVLIFGSTGSGKTETLVSLAFNTLLHGSGFIYVDGKGDNSLFAKIFSMVRYMGREDDLLLVNFMTGARDIIGPQKRRLSNTMNPFCKGSSSMLTQLVVSLMESGNSGGGDGDMWKGRAITFVEALMKILVAMRDAGHILLDANTIRNYFELDRLEAMVIDKAFIRDGQEAISLENQPEVVLQPITNYLKNLPGYNKSKKGKQVSQVLEQHGFITMQLVRAFSSLADTYGHIMRTNLAEVDFHDVVLNRRILTVLLPALEKSPDELRNLGKIVISTMKAMMAAGLGDEVIGEYRDLITRKPTNSETPFLCVLDEYGYYAVQGFAVVPAQARSLGFSVVFAGQDLPAFQKASKEEAMSIGANTNIKICMKLEDPLETWDFFQKTAGEAFVTSVENFGTDSKSMTNQYMDNRSAKVEKRARVDLLDLKDQGLGEYHIFFKSKIIRAKSFYANPQPVKEIRLNQFLKVELITDQALYEMTQRIHRIQDMAQNDELFSAEVSTSELMRSIITSLKKNAHLTPIEAGVAALLDRDGDAAEGTTGGSGSQSIQPLSAEEGTIHLFSGMTPTPYLEKIVSADMLDKMRAPILDHEETVKKLTFIERLMGQAERQAGSVGEELGKDMCRSTRYPPQERKMVTARELVAYIRVLSENIKLTKSEGGQE